MKIHDIIGILNAKVVCGENLLDKELHSACGADMMSDVLAFVKDQSVLLTGLNNPQVVKTADMMDMRCIVFVRGKEPSEELIELARERDIVILTSDLRMFTACGKLYEAGLRGGC